MRFSLAAIAQLFCSAQNSSIRAEIGGVLPVTCGMARMTLPGATQAMDRGDLPTVLLRSRV